MNLKQLVDDTIKNIRGQAMQKTTQTLANVQRGISDNLYGYKTTFSPTNIKTMESNINAQPFTRGAYAGVKKIATPIVNAVGGTFKSLQAMPMVRYAGNQAQSKALESLKLQSDIMDAQLSGRKDLYKPLMDQSYKNRKQFDQYNQYQKTIAPLAVKTGLSGAGTALTGLGLAKPGLVATNAALGTVLSAPIAKLTGQDVPTAMGEAVGGAPMLSGLLRYSNPLTEKLLGGVKGNAIIKATGKVGTAGLMNTLEDNLISLINNERPQTGMENLGSFALGGGIQAGREVLGLVMKQLRNDKQYQNLVKKLDFELRYGKIAAGEKIKQVGSAIDAKAYQVRRDGIQSTVGELLDYVSKKVDEYNSLPRNVREGGRVRLDLGLSKDVQAPGGVKDLADVKKRLLNVYSTFNEVDRTAIQKAQTVEELAPYLRKLEGGSLAKFFNSGEGQSKPVVQAPVSDISQKLYHGTDKQFTEFNPLAGEKSSQPLGALGTWFTDNRKNAENIANFRTGKGRVIETNVGLKKPKVYQSFEDLLTDIEKNGKLWETKSVNGSMLEQGNNKPVITLREQLKKQGYDGIVIRRANGASGAIDNLPDTQVVSFDNKAIGIPPKATKLSKVEITNKEKLQLRQIENQTYNSNIPQLSTKINPSTPPAPVSDIPTSKVRNKWVEDKKISEPEARKALKEMWKLESKYRGKKNINITEIEKKSIAKQYDELGKIVQTHLDTYGGFETGRGWMEGKGEGPDVKIPSTPPSPVSGIEQELNQTVTNINKYVKPEFTKRYGKFVDIVPWDVGDKELGYLAKTENAAQVIFDKKGNYKVVVGENNAAPVSGMAQGTSQRPVGQLGKNLKVTDAYGKSYLGYNMEGMEKQANKQGYNLYKSLLERVDSQGTVDAKIKGMESILDDLSGKPVSGAVKNQNALVKTGKTGSLVTQQPQLPSTKPTQTGVLQPSVKPSQSVNPQTGLPGGGQIPPKLNKSVQNLGGNQTKDLSYKVTDRLYTEFVDRFHPISKLAKVAGKDKETARAIAGYYGSGSTANYHLQQELSPILKEQNITDLKEAAIAMRDVELSSRGIKGSPEQVLAQQKLQALTSKLGPQKMQELGATLQKLYSYQDEMVKRYLVDTGIMSQASYQAMRKNNQFYVPMKRVMDQVDEFLGIPVKRGAGSMGKQNVIYGIKGSDKEIVDPIESIVENTYKLVSLGRRQEVARTIVGLRKEMPNVITRALKSDQQNTIGVFENGKKVFYNVPEEVADAARGMSEEQLVTLTKILKVPTDLFRTMTTGVNPEFLMPNVSRDTQSALFNAGVNPLKWVSGLAHFLKQDQVYKDFLKSGGKTSRISINRPYLKQTAEELAGKGFSIKSPKDIVRGLEMLSEVSEQPTRIAVFEDAYKRSLKQGMSQEEALREAAYWAQEGTVNFARRGSKMTNINAIYAYLNARVQGVDRMLRTAKKEPGRAVVRWGFGMLAPAMALYAWNNSGERGNRYNDERILSKRDKEDNFIFMLPQTKNGVDYLKIPKSEIAKVVNPVETYLDFARGKGGNIAGSVASLIKSFSPIDNVGGLIPTAINPVVENAMNKDFYTGYDLVPEYKKSLPKGYQDSNYTSPVFRMIGQKTNQSPALLQNLAESYGGGMVRIGEMASQPFIDKKYVSAKNTQGAEINRTPVLRRFMGGEKKTETEQIKANISKQNAIKFQINDVKSAIRRGDIPADVGYQQIVKLMGEMPVTQPTTQPTPMKQVSIPTVKQTPIPMPTGKGIGGGKRKKISIKKPKQIKIKLKGFKKATQKKMKAVKIKKPKNIRIVTDKTKKA